MIASRRSMTKLCGNTYVANELCTSLTSSKLSNAQPLSFGFMDLVRVLNCSSGLLRGISKRLLTIFINATVAQEKEEV